MARRSERLQGLAPIASASARWLVLGSMPSVASLEAGEYYAHPRNAFWRFVEERFAIARARPYAERCASLKREGGALWDVIGECERQGSLDSAIRDPVPNAFDRFFSSHRRLRAVFLNGGKAATLFTRHVTSPDPVDVVALPSTSPANTRREKLDDWHRAFDRLGL